MNIATYQPKGSMCMTCTHREANCSALPFHAMLVLKRMMDKDAFNVVIVRCTHFEKPSQESAQ